MDEIPEEVRKMFPDQPIQKMDIVDGELKIIASSEPLETEPDFLNMPIEQVNQYLQDHGYDPEQVKINGKILIEALIENIQLWDEICLLKKGAEKMDDRDYQIELQKDRIDELEKENIQLLNEVERLKKALDAAVNTLQMWLDAVCVDLKVRIEQEISKKR